MTRAELMTTLTDMKISIFDLAKQEIKEWKMYGDLETDTWKTNLCGLIGFLERVILDTAEDLDDKGKEILIRRVTEAQAKVKEFVDTSVLV